MVGAPFLVFIVSVIVEPRAVPLDWLVRTGSVLQILGLLPVAHGFYEPRRTFSHTNISQTDTYLNAGRLAAGPIQRYDAARGKPVANVAPIEHRPAATKKRSRGRKDCY